MGTARARERGETMSKHTEGPYRRYGLIITDERDVLVADLRPKLPKSAFDSYLSNLERPLDEQVANAVLLAAAPDLLAALEKAMDVIERLGGERGIGRMGAALDAIDAALAKAEGES